MNTLDSIRHFNRFYTHHMGLLDEDYLQTGMNLTRVRVLYEIAQGNGMTARALARALHMDEGYLSRILKNFQGRGWIERTRDRKDARQSRITLTRDGLTVLAPLEAQARAAVETRLEHLRPEERNRLVAAMQDIEQLLSGDVGEVELRDLQVGDAGWLVQQHAELYARDEGFDHTFEALVAEILAAYIRDRDPSCERAWIATRGEERLGSIFCVRQDAETAKLRLFLLRPEARGLGLGKRLLSACMTYARDRGYRRMQLWTHESHTAACALYAAFGWTLDDARPVHSFGVDLVEQSWSVTL